MNKFPYTEKMLSKNWTPGVQLWLSTNVGTGNFTYRKPQDTYTFIQYAFICEEDALAFKIMFGYK